ncbi:type 1 glutamine amidotransferase [Candidatus Microgenomates bacterium]|nr:MAG: type 1 glutamine amidotransferase [Candidatus Microgenomates bacterium]
MKKRIVIITGPGFEDSEVIYPYYRLLEEEYQVEIVTSNNKDVKGKHGIPVSPTMKIDELDSSKFEGAVIPGGHEAPDRVRQVEKILDFIISMNKKNKIISSICHGPWVLISANIVKGRNATCYKGMKDDLKNSGAIYQDCSVVVDNNLITSDHPNSLGIWMKTTISLLEK